ncbi:phage tail protein [Burkholderia sp. Bp9099]|uniref:glycine-rich domain-containing protein n=1 Tax=Burkholderia sp. Bp9099 TaxID=2184568 RepID=UPI000F5F4B7D|nr:phage tail protein [Burkholderia sp. Bp9099]
MTDRVTTWPGSIPQELDVMRNGKYAMVGIAKLAAAMLGTSTVVNGLAAVPTTPAGLTVNVTAGEIYSLINVDSTAQSSLAADTTHQILKQGISLDAVNLSCPAPGTSGQSINYLIQATYQDSDTDLNVLPYYNASNPTQAWNGPNNSGTPQATTRKGIVVLSAKAGTAATTGSQTTPAADSGYTGLWVVTVANGQTTITAGNIVQATNAPILPADLLHSIQASSLIVGTDTGAANACVVNYTYPVTALTDGMVLWFKAKAANTGATTLNVNGLGAQPIVGGNHSALQGAELVANGKAQVVWNATLTSFVLIECTGAAVQVAPATQSQHAVQLGQKGISRFTSSGTFTVPAAVTTIYVSGCAGGGGGAGGAGNNGGQPTYGVGGGGGGGGGAGQSIIRQAFTVTPGQNISITIGAAGSAGSGQASTGTAGGNTVIGSLITLPGGGAGSPGSYPSGNTVTGGGGGGGGGNGYPPGQTGSDGNLVGNGGMGGGSPFGGAGAGSKAGTTTGAMGVGAGGYGAGGGGGGGSYGTSSGTGAGGGAGSPGIAIIEW